MKKLIVLFLLACTGGIYFIGSGCQEIINGMEGPDEAGCTLYSVPKADFTTSKTEYFVGDPVTFTYTGTTGAKDDKNIVWDWTFHGPTYGDGPLGVNGRNPVVTFYSPGTYYVKVTVKNPCWNNKKEKYNYITIKTKGGE